MFTALRIDRINAVINALRARPGRCYKCIRDIVSTSAEWRPREFAITMRTNVADGTERVPIRAHARGQINIFTFAAGANCVLFLRVTRLDCVIRLLPYENRRLSTLYAELNVGRVYYTPRLRNNICVVERASAESPGVSSIVHAAS